MRLQDVVKLGGPLLNVEHDIEAKRAEIPVFARREGVLPPAFPRHCPQGAS